MTKRQRLTKRLRASKTEESVEKLEMRGQESKEAKRKTGRKGTGLADKEGIKRLAVSSFKV